MCGVAPDFFPKKAQRRGLIDFDIRYGISYNALRQFVIGN